MGELPKRKRIRLRDYDYSQGNYYFVTICTFEKEHLFGMDENLTEYGKIAKGCLESVKEVFPFVQIDKYVIMPNHVHAIIVIEDFASGESGKGAARMYACPTLGTIVGNYKSAVSRGVHAFDPGKRIWQARFYDHVIRNQKDYENTWRYIHENPAKWKTDDYYTM